MELNELLNDVQYKIIKGNLNNNISKVCYDSRKCIENSLFIAIKGFKVDGHNFIESAINNGAKTIVFDKTLKFYHENINYIKVNNSRRTLSKISSNLYNNTSKKIKIIGITGTNGKTSTSFILSKILSFSGYKVGIIGTLGNYSNSNTIKYTGHTTPESLELHEIIYNMVKTGHEYIIMEVSSHGLELDRVTDILFDTGIFTNLSRDHLDFHKDLDNYYKAKEKLFYLTKNINIINGDDTYGEKLVENLLENNIHYITYGIDSNNNVSAKDIIYSTNSVKFTCVGNNFKEKVTIPMPGKFTVYNTLASIATAINEGISINTIKNALKKLSIIPGRFERVNINAPFDVIIDFAHTPDGINNILTSIREFANGRIITVFGCGGDRDKTKRPLMGEIACKLSDYCIITSDNPRSEEPELIINDILCGIREKHCDYVRVIDRYEAIKFALNIAKEDDIVVLLGKGHETVQILKDYTIEFDEKKIVKELMGQ